MSHQNQPSLFVPAHCALLLLAGGLLLAPACNSTSSPGGQSTPEGTVQQDPDSPLNAAGLPYSFFVDGNSSGEAAEVRIVGVSWGRLVDVHGLDADGDRILIQEDFVIGADIGLDASTVYELVRNPVTATEQLVIHTDVTDTSDGVGENGQERFFRLLAEAGDAVTPIFDNNAGGSGFFTFVPRNSAVVVQFDDLLDAGSISAETVRARVGVPALLPFTARILPDRNHGDLSNAGGGGKRFYTTRVIVDTAVSELDSFETDVETPLPVNLVGLPASTTVSQANVEIRIPTETDPQVGQEILLRNVTGHSMTTIDNGSFDFAASTRDVTRSFRSGGNTAVTGDVHNGFLRDDSEPRILGSQLASIVALPIQDLNDPHTYLIPELQFLSSACAQPAEPGDVIQQPGVFLEVITASPLASNSLTDLSVRILSYPDEWDLLEPDNPTSLWRDVALGQLQYLSVYDAQGDFGSEACFLSISPVPSDFQNSPSTQLSTSSTISVRFTEPMDIASVTAFDGITLTREEPDPDCVLGSATAPCLEGSDYVVGNLVASINRTTYNFVPSLPLAHVENGITSYFLNVTSGDFVPTDLAGNAVLESIGSVLLSTDPDAQTVTNGGRVVRFAGPDEEPPFSTEDEDFPEWSGQHNFDLVRQLIRPRPVTRFQATVDRGEAMPSTWPEYGNTAPTQPPIAEPLLRYGTRTQALWRVHDLGFDAFDSTFYNVDVEEMHWAPLGGQALASVFDEFQIGLAHGAFLPDESGLFPFSGLTKTFSNNLLDPVVDPLRVVHPSFEGYIVEPAAAFQANGEQILMPFPLNRDVAANRYYTWRDTDLMARGGANGSGAPPLFWHAVTGVVAGEEVFYNSAGAVQSIQLPLLMDFRCYPTDQGIGLNIFDVGLAAGGLPAFRAFTSGGPVGDIDVTIDPDLQEVATGGFNPFSTPPGAPTSGLDSLVYFGGVDFVVRISRSSSVWYPVQSSMGNDLTQADFMTPVVVPAPEEQPIGTAVEVDLRGATLVNNTAANDNALMFDAYGDFQNGDFPWDVGNAGITPVGGSSAWTQDVEDLQGSLYYQIRLTFVSNVQSGESPVVSAIGVAWSE